MKAEKSIRELCAEAANATITGAIVKMADALNGRLLESKRLGRQRPELLKVQRAGSDEIARSVLEIVAIERDRLACELKHREKVWLDDRARHTEKRRLALDEAREHFGAMSDTELRAELEHLAEAEFVTSDAPVVDALFVAARRSAIDRAEVDAVRELALKKRYRDGWLQNQETAGLQREHEAYKKCKPREFPIIDRTQAGKVRTAYLSLEDLALGENEL
ncbi:MAG: hypothetical protein FJ088_13105 [Deltaproteobacteria bacterium]|nr:hypothetical protein [Deltaproteobacteria bacterium]